MPEMQDSLVEQAAKERKKQKWREWWPKYYAKNREKLIQRTHTWNLENRKRKRVWERLYYKKNRERIIANSNRRIKANPEKHNEYNRRKEVRLQLQIFAAYGGAFCRCCGEMERKFLSIDHIAHGRGNPAPRPKNLYRWIKRSNFPAGFQVLCHNCNQAKGLHRSCPHTEWRTPIDAFFSNHLNSHLPNPGLR